MSEQTISLLGKIHVSDIEGLTDPLAVVTYAGNRISQFEEEMNNFVEISESEINISSAAGLVMPPTSYYSGNSYITANATSTNKWWIGNNDIYESTVQQKCEDDHNYLVGLGRGNTDPDLYASMLPSSWGSIGKDNFMSSLISFDYISYVYNIEGGSYVTIETPIVSSQISYTCMCILNDDNTTSDGIPTFSIQPIVINSNQTDSTSDYPIWSSESNSELEAAGQKLPTWIKSLPEQPAPGINYIKCTRIYIPDPIRMVCLGNNSSYNKIKVVSPANGLYIRDVNLGSGANAGKIVFGSGYGTKAISNGNRTWFGHQTTRILGKKLTSDTEVVTFPNKFYYLPNTTIGSATYFNLQTAPAANKLNTYYEDDYETLLDSSESTASDKSRFLAINEYVRVICLEGVTDTFDLVKGDTFVIKIDLRYDRNYTRFVLANEDGTQIFTEPIPIWYNNGQFETTNNWVNTSAVNTYITYIYDGTHMRWINWYSEQDSTHIAQVYSSQAYTLKGDLKAYKLVAFDDNYMVPISNVQPSAAAVAGDRGMTTQEFNVLSDIKYYYSTANNTNNSNVSLAIDISTHEVDLRWTFNLYMANQFNGIKLNPYKSLYLVCVPQANGKVKLHSTPITQTLPNSEDGLLYKYLGNVAASTYNVTENAVTTAQAYALTICPYQPVYYYKDGILRMYTGNEELCIYPDLESTNPTPVSTYFYNKMPIASINGNTNPEYINGVLRNLAAAGNTPGVVKTKFPFDNLMSYVHLGGIKYNFTNVTLYYSGGDDDVSLWDDNFDLLFDSYDLFSLKLDYDLWADDNSFTASNVNPNGRPFVRIYGGYSPLGQYEAYIAYYNLGGLFNYSV